MVAAVADRDDVIDHERRIANGAPPAAVPVAVKDEVAQRAVVLEHVEAQALGRERHAPTLPFVVDEPLGARHAAPHATTAGAGRTS